MPTASRPTAAPSLKLAFLTAMTAAFITSQSHAASCDPIFASQPWLRPGAVTKNSEARTWIEELKPRSPGDFLMAYQDVHGELPTAQVFSDVVTAHSHDSGRWRAGVQPAPAQGSPYAYHFEGLRKYARLVEDLTAMHTRSRANYFFKIIGDDFAGHAGHPGLLEIDPNIAKALGRVHEGLVNIYERNLLVREPQRVPSVLAIYRAAIVDLYLLSMSRHGEQLVGGNAQVRDLIENSMLAPELPARILSDVYTAVAFEYVRESFGEVLPLNEQLNFARQMGLDNADPGVLVLYVKYRLPKEPSREDWLRAIHDRREKLPKVDQSAEETAKLLGIHL